MHDILQHASGQGRLLTSKGTINPPSRHSPTPLPNAHVGLLLAAPRALPRARQAAAKKGVIVTVLACRPVWHIVAIRVLPCPPLLLLALAAHGATPSRCACCLTASGARAQGQRRLAAWVERILGLGGEAGLAGQALHVWLAVLRVPRRLLPHRHAVLQQEGGKSCSARACIRGS